MVTHYIYSLIFIEVDELDNEPFGAEIGMFSTLDRAKTALDGIAWHRNENDKYVWDWHGIRGRDAFAIRELALDEINFDVEQLKEGGE